MTRDKQNGSSRLLTVPECMKAVQEIRQKRDSILQCYMAGEASLQECLTAVDSLAPSARGFPSLYAMLARPWTQEKWERLQDDYRLWKAGERCQSRRGKEWLKEKVCLTKGPAEDIDGLKRKISAVYRTEEDFGRPFLPEGEKCVIQDDVSSDPAMKELFFTLMSLLLVPLSDFACGNGQEEIPHAYGCVQEIFFRCVDDGGLFGETDPLNKRYTLVDETGTAAHFTVRGYGYGYDGTLYYQGTGYVADYMQCMDHDLKIALIGKNGDQFRIIPALLNEEDKKAYLESPRWRPYFEHLRQNERYREREHVKQLTAQMAKKPGT